MPTARPTSAPPRPRPGGSSAEFCATLKLLRSWAGLTLMALEDRHELLKRSTTSDYENARRWPQWLFVDAFVRTCLAHGGFSEPSVKAELKAWQVAWHALTRTGGTPPPLTEAPAEEQAPAEHAHAQPPTAAPHAAGTDGQANPMSRTAIGRPRGRLMLGVAAIGLVLLGAGGVVYMALAANGVLGGRGSSFPSSDAPSSQGSTMEETPTALVHSGIVDALSDDDGIDLDTGIISASENAPGADISPYGQASHLGAMDLAVQYAVLPSMGRVSERKTVCEHATGWTRLYSQLYALGIGRVICVRTDQGHLAMLVIEKPATPATSTLGFHYYTWK